MSGAAPWGRSTPRWSVVKPGTAAPASMAGLPGNRAWGGGGPAVEGQRAEPWSGVDQIGGIEGDGRCVGEEVVAERGDCPRPVEDIAAGPVGEETRDAPEGGAESSVIDAAAERTRIVGEGGGGERQ